MQIKELTISNLLKKMENQAIGLPEFQRDFIWTPRQMASLIMSILRRYPIGTFLFLNRKNNPHILPRSIAGIDIRDERKSQLIVMDGQQRLTTLYYVTHQNNRGVFDYKSSKYSLFLLLDELKSSNIHHLDENFIYPENIPSADHPFLYDEKYQFEYKEMPLYVFWDDNKRNAWLNKAIRHGVIGKRKKQLINNLAKNLQKHEIPIHSINYHIEDEALCNIFELINNSGTELDGFDLAVASLQKDKIDLRKLWKEAYSQYEHFKTDKYDVDPNWILKTILLVRKTINTRGENKTTCTGKDIKNIIKLYPKNRKNQFESDWRKAAKFCDEALGYINDKFGADSANKIPYSPTIVVIASMLWWGKEKNISENQIFKKLKTWYWRSVFNHSYDASTNQQISDDFYFLREWIRGSKKRTPFPKIDITQLPLNSLVNNRDAIYKAILCLPYLQEAEDLLKPRKLQGAQVDDHHIFPKAWLNKKGWSYSDKEVNCVLNRTYIYSETNRGQIGGKNPTKYFKELDENIFNNKIDQETKRKLMKHFIDEKAIGCIRREHFRGFLKQRNKLILKFIRNNLR